MSRTDSSITHEEKKTFEDSMHLYATNNSVALHNKTILKILNMLVAVCLAEKHREHTFTTSKEEQIDAKVLLCSGKKFMLTRILWVHVGLGNGALGTVISIFYAPNSKPPEFPSFVVVDFKQYKVKIQRNTMGHFTPNICTHFPYHKRCTSKNTTLNGMGFNNTQVIRNEIREGNN